MSEIQFMEKPDWVSWDDVCECIRKANVVNDKQGFHMLFSNITPDEIAKKVKNGTCFVALHNNKVVGTASFVISDVRSWCLRGKVICFCYDGILPEYRGTDVYLGLRKIKYDRANKTGIKKKFFTTAEHNKTVIKINLKFGFKLVQYQPTGEGADYYSVTMVKWDDGCPFPEWFLNFMFNMSKFVSKTFLRPDYKLKFWFN